MPPAFETLYCWHDDLPRDGPANMAVDQWLLETAAAPVLRAYRWQPGWGSLGYFGSLAAARLDFPVLQWVRRWTGGGTVDHRADWTYTLVIPAHLPLAQARGPESYCLLHSALAGALHLENRPAVLTPGHHETGAPACFENPVTHDLVDDLDRKIAGAGQRRSREGLLHQGSVSGTVSPALSKLRSERLAQALAIETVPWSMIPAPGEIQARRARYADNRWTARR